MLSLCQSSSLISKAPEKAADFSFYGIHTLTILFFIVFSRETPPASVGEKTGVLFFLSKNQKTETPYKPIMREYSLI
jgi:hypothetical protein